MANRVKTKYEADNSKIHRLYLNSDDAAKAGTEPTADIDDDIIAKVSKGNREFGLRPRGVRLSRLAGTAPDQFYRYKFLPLRSKADYTSSTYAKGQTVTIGTVTWTIDSKVPEDY